MQNRRGRSEQRNVVALGMFDGVHIGHQKLLKIASELGIRCGYASLALTFNRHPMEVVKPGCAPPLISDIYEKCSLIAACGIDEVRVVDFTPSFAQMDPRAFIWDYLRLKLKARVVVAGFNYTFGRGGRGDADFLKAEGKRAGMELHIVPPVIYKRQVVSSSLIREKISAGLVEDAARLLGRDFTFTGVVVPGEGRGKDLGYPTANIEVGRRRLIPGQGVYLAAINISEREQGYGLLSIGTKPTFGGRENVIEAHVLDFDGNLYGKVLRVVVLRKLRDILRFPDRETLVRQIARDVEMARRLLETELKAGRYRPESVRRPTWPSWADAAKISSAK